MSNSKLVQHTLIGGMGLKHNKNNAAHETMARHLAAYRSKTLSYLFSMVLFCACCFANASQPTSPSIQNKTQLNFKTYTVFDGLPQGQVLALQVDQTGYLWTGSYAGVTRYDGREFLNFSDELPHHSINAMTMTPQGVLLIGTAAGFCRLKNMTFSCEQQSERLPFQNIDVITVNNENDYWLGADGGLIHYQEDTSRIYTKADGLPSASVRAITKDHTGRLWVGTDDGLAYLQNNRLVNFRPDLFTHRSVRTLLSTEEGVWIGASGGLFLANPDTLSVEPIFSEIFTNHSLLSLFKDSKGHLWIGTYTDLFRLVDGRITQLSPQNGLQSKAIYVIKEDQEGVLWMGSDAGLVKYVPSPFVGYTRDSGLVHDFVRAIDIAPDGKVWLGTREGLSILDPETNIFTNVKESLGPGLWRIYAVIVLSDNEALLGSQIGLIHWKNNQVHHIYRDETPDDALPASYVSAFTRSADGSIWIGTRRGLAKWVNGQLSKVADAQLNFGGIFALETDSSGKVWIGSGSLGLVIYDPNTMTYSQPDSIFNATGLNIWDIDRDQNGNLWVGTNGKGLIGFNEQFQQIAQYHRDNGLNDNFIWQVLSDSRGNIWSYTNTGLNKFDGNQFVHYDGGDGLLDLEGAATAVAEHPNGEIWFGTAYGVMRYTPDSDIPPQVAPPIVIEGAWQGIHPQLNHLTNLFDEGSLTIKFASLSFRDERDIKFAYRLLGADEQWSLPIKENQVHFAKLASGKYTFEVKAINGRNIESTEPARFSFTIAQPFWKQLWFIVLLVALAILIIYCLFKLRLRHVEAERKRLQKLVAERTATIEKVNKTLQQLVITDELTGLYNRRYLMESLESAMHRLQRAPKSSHLSFIMIDVDHFKQINDSFGHLIGDEVLKEIGNRLQASLRKTDIATRYGGEEFAILLPHTDESGALNIAEKFRQLFNDNPIEFRNEMPIKITISLGVSSISQPQLRANPITSSQFISQADKALYVAKEKGRNQVVNYSKAQALKSS